ncbi:MAG: hypothetical protein HQL51_09925 [Magnetococcales bacterium]|nr:hypothetical protein [Magnetococcales bacterium]
MTTCPKCGHARQPGDLAPTGECPRCGAIYAKALRSEIAAAKVAPAAVVGALAEPAPRHGWRNVRIAALLMLLVMVASTTLLTRMRVADWSRPLPVLLFPVQGDDSPVTARHLQSLTLENFQELETFFIREAKRYQLPMENPLRLQLEKPLLEQPPEPPREPTPLKVIAWSLGLRFWVTRLDPEFRPGGRVRLFLVFHDPGLKPTVPHSLGLEKGMIGVAHLFADPGMARENLVVTAHELMHTVGASDQYDPVTNLPRYPEGYAEPERKPLHPQVWTELMGGRLPIAPDRADPPASLAQVVIGTAAAQESGWLARRAANPTPGK